MNEVNKTLYIPLYGKAYVSRKGILLHDPKAEEIWAAEGFALKGKSRSKWLAYYMGMRSAVFDRWVTEKLEQEPDAVVLHIGCGMDSRVERVKKDARMWYDVDFPEVIRERKRYFREKEGYRMIGTDVQDGAWLKQIGGQRVIVVMEGVSMYLPPEELAKLLGRLRERFSRVWLLMDCYTRFAAKMSKIRNPINDVGVTQVYGMDDPLEVSALKFVKRHSMTPQHMIDQLKGAEKLIFRKLYAGKMSEKLYRLYEYEKEVCYDL